MKKIAKGISLFLISFLLLLPTTFLTCYATEDETSIGVIDDTSETDENRFVIVNSIGSNLNVSCEDYTVVLENQSSKKIKGIKIIVEVNGEKEKVIRKRSNLKGFESYNVDLTEYFSGDYMEGKDIKLDIENCFSGWEIFWLVIIVLFLLTVIFDIVAMIALQNIEDELLE